MSHLPRLNVVLLGHHQSGKSTLAGHLSCLQREFTVNPNGLPFKQISDYTANEISCGHSVNTSYLRCDASEVFQIMVMDAPSKFPRAAVHAISQADVAVIVVSSVKGEYEESLVPHTGTTWQHLILARAFGIKDLIVCVNKMAHDSVNYSPDNLKLVRDQIFPLAKKSGFRRPFVVSVDAETGENLRDRCSKMMWSSKSLLNLIDSMEPPTRDENSPLRFVLQESYQISGIGIVVSGTILRGSISPGDVLQFNPASDFLPSVEVKSLEMRLQPVERAIAGDFVSVNIRGSSGARIRWRCMGIKRGQLMSQETLPGVTQFYAILSILRAPGGVICCGYTPTCLFATRHISCTIVEIAEEYSRKNKKVKGHPQTLTSGNLVKVLMRTESQHLQVELKEELSRMGRFAIYERGLIVAVGTIETILAPQERITQRKPETTVSKNTGRLTKAAK